MSNLARQLISDWSEDEATLLYDAPSRSSQRRAIQAVPDEPSPAPTLATRAGSGPLSQVQLIVTVVAAMIGAMIAARSTLERAPQGSTAPAPASPTAKATEVRASALPAQPPAPAPARIESAPSQRAKVAAAPTRDRRAERIAARPRSSPRAQSRPASAERDAQPAAAPRPAAVAPASNRRGTLRINSRPWSKVYVDGRAIGNTPQMAIALEPGTHRVKLVNEQFELERTLNLEVRPGQTVTRIVEMMQ
jgi:serine/threonine-protein kinase